MKKNVRCAVIGQHPLRFPWGFDEEDDGCRRMKLEMAQRIMELRQRGVTEFQVACDPGVGLYAAEIINIMREKDKSLRLVCVMPHEEQATKWTPQLRERYFNMLAGCTELDCIDFHEQPDAQLWPISGSSSRQPWCWLSMPPTLRMGAPRIRLCPMRLHWAGQSC